MQVGGAQRGSPASPVLPQTAYLLSCPQVHKTMPACSQAQSSPYTWAWPCSPRPCPYRACNSISSASLAGQAPKRFLALGYFLKETLRLLNGQSLRAGSGVERGNAGPGFCPLSFLEATRSRRCENTLFIKDQRRETGLPILYGTKS